MCLKAFVQRTGADELMVVSDIYEPEKRFRSFEIIADAAADAFSKERETVRA